MDKSIKHDAPWELISGSLTGSLSAEENLWLQQWMSANPANKALYDSASNIWKNKVDDYMYFKMANPQEAWNALQNQLSNNPEPKVLKGDFTRRTLIRRFTAIAAVFALLIGLGGWFLLTRNNPQVYETAVNEQKTIWLVDSSSVTLLPSTRIEIGSDYNKTNRTVLMSSGKAIFEVKHITEKPFTVELGITQVKDIGTSFVIQRNEKEINVEVNSGKVAFIKRITRETKELVAGTRITYDVHKESFGNVSITPSSSWTRKQLLNFDNTPLLEVAKVIHQAYGKKVILSDPTLVNKRITAHLNGMPIEKAMEVICKSMGLEYADNDSVYVLKAREKEQH